MRAAILLFFFLVSCLGLPQSSFGQEDFAAGKEGFAAEQENFTIGQENFAAGRKSAVAGRKYPVFGQEPLVGVQQDSAIAGDDSAAGPEGEDGDPSFLSRFGTRLKDTWQKGSWDLYVPAYTWHNRLMYDSARAQKYNETPWGAGIGKSMLDEDGDRHFLYIMGFQDSHDRFEPYGGYAFQKNWYAGDEKQYSAGLGFALGITAREQYNYIPFPLPLPMAELRYKRLAVQAVYIPGGYNDGNVLFTWLRWNFE